MEEMGLTVLAVKPENQAGLFDAIELLAQATNTTARGEELEMAIDSNLAALAEAVAGTDAPAFTWQATAPCWKPQAPPCIRTR